MTEVLLELINNIKLISTIYPKINLMLGISNLSSTFRGYNKIREALHRTFLRYTELFVGLNFGIVNVQNQISYSELSTKIRTLFRSLIFDSKRVSMEQFLDVFGTKSFGPNNDGYRDN